MYNKIDKQTRWLPSNTHNHVDVEEEVIDEKIDHLSRLANELKVDHKLPRIVFWKKEDARKKYLQRIELFKMFADMSIRQICHN